ncbi:MAG: hypothetical protein FJY82_03415 [Candidatus Aminicenantes bacterium]|nr:hypothetical protein [Candidatus Aminicenantes bacterium]
MTLRRRLGLLLIAAGLSAACVPVPFPGPETAPGGPDRADELAADRPGYAGADRRGAVFELSAELERRAAYLAESSFHHFRGWNNAFTDQEQAILFSSEAFAASCRLFHRLAETASDYYHRTYRRTNLYSAFLYLARSFRALEDEMRKGGLRPFELQESRRLLDRIEREFRNWPDADNLAYLDDKYVKGRDAAVYLIVREGAGTYSRRPFKNLESLFKYNYDRKRGGNPWDHFVEVEERTLAKMRTGRMIELSFEGLMIVEPGERRNRPVYLIEKGKRRGLTRPEIVNRYGGWGNVFEVPREVIEAYPEGPPIDAPASGHIKK